MTLILHNDSLEDTPQQEVENGFFELNNTMSPALLPSGVVSRADNLWFDTDGVANTRPGLRLVSNVYATTTAPVLGMAYYDVPTREAVLMASGTNVYEVTSDQPTQTPVAVATGLISATGRKMFAQLVDRMFIADDTALRWVMYSGGSWSNGSVTQYTSGAAMPAFRVLAAHRFRLFGVAAESDKIQVSKILTAHNSGGGGDWIETDNVRVGTGGGDPINALISGQVASLIALCKGSAWEIDTSDLLPANWTIRKLTDKTGCAAGATAILIGQDVYFLSRLGVMTLSGLVTTDTVSAASAVSAPIQATIDRINWAAVDGTYGAKSTLWGHLLLMAIPVDGSTYANHVIAYNTRTRRWVGEWSTLNDQFSTGLGGWGEAGLTRFNGKAETLWADIDGGLYRLDDTYTRDDVAGAASVEIDSLLRTRAFVNGAQEIVKQPFWLEAEFYKCSSTGLSIMVVPDDEQTYPDIPLVETRMVQQDFSGSNSPVLPLSLPFAFTTRFTRRWPWLIRNQPRFREMAIQVHSNRGSLRLRKLRFAAFLDAVKLK